MRVRKVSELEYQEPTNYSPEAANTDEHQDGSSYNPDDEVEGSQATGIAFYRPIKVL